jgi:hypothetical protein
MITVDLLSGRLGQSRRGNPADYSRSASIGETSKTMILSIPSRDAARLMVETMRKKGDDAFEKGIIRLTYHGP